MCGDSDALKLSTNNVSSVLKVFFVHSKNLQRKQHLFNIIPELHVVLLCTVVYTVGRRKKEGRLSRLIRFLSSAAGVKTMFLLLLRLII